jgi:hypothetical protein
MHVELTATAPRTRPMPWVLSPARDLALIAVPFALAAMAWALDARGVGQAQGLAYWTAQNVLGNGPHVMLTFVLLFFRRDVLRADPEQGRKIALGGAAMLLVGAGLFWAWTWNPAANLALGAVIFNVFGLHHTLSQAKGFWSLHHLRSREAGLPAASPFEQRLLRLFVPLMLSLFLVRLMFVPLAPGIGAFVDVGQRALLPFGAVGLLLFVWLAFFGALFLVLSKEEAGSLPKRIYLVAQAAASALVLLAPQWGVVVYPGMHGLEYYFLTARMLEPRDAGETERLPRRWIWPAMVLAMLPLFALGVAGLALDKLAPHFGQAALFRDGALFRAAIVLMMSVVLTHYCADAFLYRMRIPAIRKVMLRRLGFEQR